MAERDENLKDLTKQASQTTRPAPPVPKLAQLAKGVVRPEVLAVFEQYDRQWEEWKTKSQVSGT